MNLYEIDNTITACIDVQTGEIIDCDRLEQIQMERSRKIENIGCWIKNLRAQAQALKMEEQRLYARRKAIQNKRDSLEGFLRAYLAGEMFESPRLAIRFRRSKGVAVKEQAQIPQEFLTCKSPQPDKVKIRKALESGMAVPGAEMIERQCMQIQ